MQFFYSVLIGFAVAITSFSPTTALAAPKPTHQSPFGFFPNLFQQKPEKPRVIKAALKPARIEIPTKAAFVTAVRYEYIAGRELERKLAAMPPFHSVRHWDESTRKWQYSLVHGPDPTWFTKEAESLTFCTEIGKSGKSKGLHVTVVCKR